LHVSAAQSGVAQSSPDQPAGQLQAAAPLIVLQLPCTQLMDAQSGVAHSAPLHPAAQTQRATPRPVSQLP
jgi:hypothetical protein